MKVAITGASGLIGAALAASLAADDITVQPLVRRPSSDANAVRWSPSEGSIDADALRGTDVLVHLAGEPIIGPRWTAEKKRRVLASRVDGTRLIARTLAKLPDGPRILLSASAVGYYGNSTEWVDETSPRGDGFLAEVCEAWEQSADEAREAGIRVVHPRIGLVLSADGGALGQMLPAFRLGLGGPIGDGEQYFPWVAIDDVVAALRFAIDGEIEGPMNVVAPEVVTNNEFTRVLADCLRRPSFFRVPKFAVRAALGEMGQETLLSGQRVRPLRLTEHGFEFAFGSLSSALEHLL